MSSQKNSITVLVVDDETDIRTLIKTIIEAPDVRVLEAENGSVALGLVGMEAIDLVISDIRMPEMDGYRLLDKIKQLGEPHELPQLVFMTGYIDQQRSSAIGMGAAGMIQKPFTGRQFLSWLHISVSEKLKPFFARKLRFPVELPVQYGMLPNDLKHSGMVLNVSQGGMLIGAFQTIPHSGELIHCAVKTDSGQIIPLVGDVRWVKDLGDESYRAGFGLELSASNPTNLQLLHNLVRSLASRSALKK